MPLSTADRLRPELRAGSGKARRCPAVEGPRPSIEEPATGAHCIGAFEVGCPPAPIHPRPAASRSSFSGVIGHPPLAPPGGAAKRARHSGIPSSSTTGSSPGAARPVARIRDQCASTPPARETARTHASQALRVAATCQVHGTNHVAGPPEPRVPLRPLAVGRTGAAEPPGAGSRPQRPRRNLHFGDSLRLLVRIMGRVLHFHTGR